MWGITWQGKFYLSSSQRYWTGHSPHQCFYPSLDVATNGPAFLSPSLFVSGSKPELPLSCLYSSSQEILKYVLLTPWFRYFYNLFYFPSNRIFFQSINHAAVPFLNLFRTFPLFLNLPLCFYNVWSPFPTYLGCVSCTVPFICPQVNNLPSSLPFPWNNCPKCCQRALFLKVNFLKSPTCNLWLPTHI